MARVSGGKYLEVLAARPQHGVRLEAFAYDGASPGTMLAQLDGASDVRFQHMLSDVGAGSLRIADADPKAIAANIREGNLIRIRLNGVDVFAYFVESTTHVVSESGASEWQVGGSGALSVLSQAVAYPPGWPTPTGTDRAWSGATAGLILGTLVSEAQARGALAHVSTDFTATADSHSAPWPSDLTLTVHAGTTVLDVAKQLAALGYVVRMTPSLTLQAFVPGTYGRDLSTSVVWRWGRHIAGDVSDADSLGRAPGRSARSSPLAGGHRLTRIGVRTSLQNAELVEGAGGKFVEVNDPTSQADPYTGRREGGLQFTQSSDPTTLQTAGNAQMEFTAAESNSVTVPLAHGSGPGEYTPYADYQPGDWVSLDVPGSYSMERLQVVALTLAQTDAGDYTISADLNAVALDYLARLRNLISGAAGGSGGTTGGVTSALRYGAPPPTGTPVSSAPATASAPGDTAAAGSSTSASAADHRHGREAWGLAADIGPESFGAAAAAGVSGKVADAGHVHPMPAAPSVPSPATTVTGPDAFGASAVVGTATTYARGDHDHGLPSATVGGDLSGTLPNPTVAKVNGVAVTGTPTAGQVPTATSGSAATWQTPSGGGMTNPMTTQDDIIVGGVAGAPGRLGKGTSGQVLTVDPSTGHLLWANSASGFADPTTTKGDLIAHGTSTTRLPVGSDTQVLTADSTQALGMKWAAAGGGATDAILGQSGGGGARISGLQSAPDIDVGGTSDDEFNAALSGWTTFGTPDSCDSNSTHKSMLTIVKSGSGTQWAGVYKAPPSTPFTVTAKLAAGNLLATLGFAGADRAHGLFVGEATLGKFMPVNITVPGSTSDGLAQMQVQYWTSPTAWSSNWKQGGHGFPYPPVYFRIVATSTTSVASFYSYDGLTWNCFDSGRNPGFTIGSVGLALSRGGSASDNCVSVWDWIRFT